MDDLLDLDWQSAGPKTASSVAQSASRPVNVNYNPIFQRQNNPFSQQNSAPRSSAASNANSSPASSINADLFGGLVNFGTKKSEKLTMAQQAGMTLRWDLSYD